MQTKISETEKTKIFMREMFQALQHTKHLEEFKFHFKCKSN